ncbi:helix-turn-helix domain-containing protein [Nocardia sp. NBC_00565]|uniref:helix-turn-helix domain-containing protein n=1 Tax=Nocardia sp. NBC_00565 TaxID=2975993 RepID=UPI002E820E90|nr:helix-turn-helix transcriptional regulator [Nocardia sp. NBC_00565]WUC01085.1 helix-turn-helix domain-containing protein [Nocardia sp. NBC_00565]
MSTGSTLPRRLLGRELHDLRENAGITMDVAKAAISVGKQTIWRMETGQPVRLRFIDIERLCQVYGATQEQTEILLGLTEEAQGKGWWHAYGDAIPKHFDLFVGLEQAAVRLTTYQAALVPGLLQIPDYRREVIWAEVPNADTAEVERRIELAARRQDRLTDDSNPLALDVVLDELPLRRPIGSPEIMAAQLRHIAEVSRLKNVSVRVVPADAGTHPGLLVGTFVLLEFPKHPTAHLTEPPVIYVQGYTGALYLEKPEEVQQYRDAYTRLQRAALNEADSRRLILKIAEELTR